MISGHVPPALDGPGKAALMSIKAAETLSILVYF
jgi:hypothetical protein